MVPDPQSARVGVTVFSLGGTIAMSRGDSRAGAVPALSGQELIDGVPGAVWAPGGRPRAVFAFRVVGSMVTEIEIVSDPAVVRSLQVELLS